MDEKPKLDYAAPEIGTPDPQLSPGGWKKLGAGLIVGGVAFFFFAWGTERLKTAPPSPEDVSATTNLIFTCLMAGILILSGIGFLMLGVRLSKSDQSLRSNSLKISTQRTTKAKTVD